MSFFDLLKFSKGEISNACPYCGIILNKEIKRKTKCVECDNFMYVRTKVNNKKVLVTEESADKIDEQWRIKNGTQEEYLKDKSKFERKKEILENKYKRSFTNNEIELRILHEESVNYLKNKQYGSYSSCLSNISSIYERNMKELEISLKGYLKVCYLDLNGAENITLNVKKEDEWLFCDEKPFNLEFKFLAPGIIDRIRIIMKKLKINKKNLRNIYLNVNDEIYKNLKAPLSPSETIDEFLKEFKEK